MVAIKARDFAIAIVFALLMTSLPWSDWQGAEFVDLKRYLHYFLHGQSILEYTEFKNPLDYLFSEALWHYSIFKLINEYGFSIHHIFKAISLLCVSTFSFFLIRRHGFLSLVLLINPLLVSLAMSQVRMALAFSLMLVAYMVRKKFIISLAFILAALFIHTSTLLFVSIYLVVKVISDNKIIHFKSSGSTFLLLCGLGLIVSLAIGPLREMILGYFGDRRAGYGDASSSILYTSFWISILFFCWRQGRSFFSDEVNCFVVVILSLVGFNLLTGGYTTRFLAVALPMTMSAMLSFRPTDKSIFTFAYVAYCIFQWVYWLQVKMV